jgi:hypothetical protein
MPTSWHDPDGTLHEIYTASVIADGVFLGQFTYDSGRRDLAWPRHGWAYFCRQCGSVWAVISASSPSGYKVSFEPVIATCKDHYDQWDVPGTLLHLPVLLLLPDLPLEVVQREFELHLNHFEKELAL